MRRLVPALIALLTLAFAAPAAAQTAGHTSFLVDREGVPSGRDPEIAVTYAVGVRGASRAGLPAFRAAAEAALTDPRGWSVDGTIAFVPTGRDPDFRLWLAGPGEVAAAAAACDADYSCRVGDDIYINARRWRIGTDTYRHRPLAEYRRYVITHEVGHWLGLDHPGCAGVGEQAPVMLQQSKDLEGCDARPWPLPGEQREALRGLRRR